MTSPDLSSVPLPVLAGLSTLEKEHALKWFMAGAAAAWPVAEKRGRTIGRDEGMGLGIEESIQVLQRRIRHGE